MTTQNYILKNHWTLDMSGQSIYTYYYPNLVMDAQILLFRYLNQQEASSSETIAHPLADGAKKCKSCNIKFVSKHKDCLFCSNKCWQQQPHRKEYSKNWNRLNKNRKKSYLYNKNKLCVDCKIFISNRGYRCTSCNNKFLAAIHHQHFIKKQNDKWNKIDISNNTEQIILGSLLGDASLRSSKRKIVKSIFCNLIFTHCLEQTDYFKWKSNLINLPCKISIHTAKQNATISNYKFNYYGTPSLPQLLPYYNLLYPNGKKVVTREILDKLEPLGLAVWYMDDGSYDVPNASIYTNGFTLEENKLIQIYFKEKFNLSIKIRTDVHNRNKPTYYISFDAESSRKFFELIKPHIPKCMNYKTIPNQQRIENKKRYNKEWKKKA